VTAVPDPATPVQSFGLRRRFLFGDLGREAHQRLLESFLAVPLLLIPEMISLVFDIPLHR